MRRGPLWFAVLGPPLAWIGDELVSLYVHEGACTVLGRPRIAGVPLAPAAIAASGAITLVVALAALRTARAAQFRLGGGGAGESGVEQDRFMARAGTLSAIVFGFGILLRLIGGLVVSPCVS